MKRFNSVFTVPVRSLEVGDLMAMEFIGSVTSGVITGIHYTSSNLTQTQIEYLKSQHIEISDNFLEPIGGHNLILLFGDFYGPGIDMKHMFVELDKNVAVFPRREKEK